MSIKPIVAIDYETLDSRGASFEYFRKDFELFSLSCAWRDDQGKLQQWFSMNPREMKEKLQELHDNQNPIVVHNLAFEQGVTQSCYPDLSLNWYCDTMRLAQLFDGGSEYWVKYEPTMDDLIAIESGEMTKRDLKRKGAEQVGLSLEACGMRFLTDAGLHKHKAEAHNYLKEHHKIKPNKVGRNLHLLPVDILERYNNYDTEVTLKLYEELTEKHKSLGFDWEKDNLLYIDRVNLMAPAYQRGIKINRPKLLKYICDLEKEIEDITNVFLERFRPEIEKVIKIRLQLYIDKIVNAPAKRNDTTYNRFVNVLVGKYDLQWNLFNVNSNHQLKLLFCDVLKMQPDFLTPKGSPSFKSTHLAQWGSGGEILIKRKKRILVIQQCINTYIGSAYDGRIHPSIKVAGTRTNRVSGGTNS